jgi:hypothetical protein
MSNEPIDFDKVRPYDLGDAIRNIRIVGWENLPTYMAEVAENRAKFSETTNDFLNLFLKLFETEITNELETMEIEAKYPEPNDEG